MTAQSPAGQVWRLFIGPAFDLLKKQFRDHYAGHRLTAAQACMLEGLTEPMSQREAAVRLGYDPSNITALADALESKGLVERRPDPTDRRVKTLARTAEGELMARDLDARFQQPTGGLEPAVPGGTGAAPGPAGKGVPRRRLMATRAGFDLDPPGCLLLDRP
jgi:DNA-binding MarR family transcriptional regulator